MNCYFNCKAFVALILTWCLCSFAARAQEQAPSVMTLHDCMEYAVSNSTKIRISEADRNDEQALRRQAIMQAFTPNVTAGTSANSQFGRNIDPETNIYSDNISFRNNYSADASITLFNGFKAINNIKVSSVSAKMGLSKDEQTRNEICLAAMEAYYNVIYYSSLAKVLDNQVETARIALLKAEREEDYGTKAHADVVQMRSELAQKEYKLITTQNQYNDALITLKDIMFWPVEKDLLLDENVVEPILLSADAAEIARFAKVNQPSALIAKYTKDNAATELKSARWSYSPTLSLQAGIGSNYVSYPGSSEVPASFDKQLKDNLGEQIYVQLTIPIFDKFSRRTQINQKKNAFSRASAQYDQKMRDIENAVYRAVNDRDGAEAAFRQAERLAEVQEEAFNLNSRRFEQGLISSIEYHTASETYLNACAERLGSLFKYCLKDSVVKFYNGTPYIEQF